MSGAPQRPPFRFELGGRALAIVEPSQDVPLVTLVVALRCGSSVDPAEKSGLARIAMRMLRRGCEGLTSEQIDFRIDALGAEMAVDTSASTVAIHAQIIARNVEPFFDLLARMLRTSTFPDEELERLKRESIAEIIEARDSDRSVAQKAFQRTMFDGHAYGRNAGGTTQTIAAIRRPDVIDFYRRYVVRSNIVIGFAGDLSPEKASRLAERLLDGVSQGTPAVESLPEPQPVSGRRLLVVDKPERTQTQILVGTLGTAPTDSDHVPLTVANAAFGGTFTSRLMREIRSKRGWSYGASARLAIDRHRQAWLLWTFPAEQDAGPCLKLSIDLLDEWVAGGVTGEEVDFIRSYLVRSHAFDIDTAAKRLHQALDVELLGLPSDYYSQWVGRVRAVTPQAASAAVQKRIDPKNLLVVVVATAAGALDPLRAAVAGLADSRVVPFDLE